MQRGASATPIGMKPIVLFNQRVARLYAIVNVHTHMSELHFI